MTNPGGPTTWFSGKSAPEDQKGPSPLLVFAVLFTIFSPIGTIVLALCYIAFNYYRVSHKVIAGTAALYAIPYFTGITFFSSATTMLADYNAPLRTLITAIKDKNTEGFIADNWWFWFTSQVWLSIALGLICGAAFTTWKWIRRPAWEDNDRVPGPVHRYRRRKAIKDISSDQAGPPDGATLGVDMYGNRITQTQAEAAAHTLLAGGSGSGKTTTMMVGIRDAIRRGEPVCVVDMKGAADLPAQVAEWCHRYNRRFLHWSITDRRAGYTGPADGPAFYDPIGRGDPSRKKDLLIGSEKWDVEYYKSVNENYLQIAFQIAELDPDPSVDAFSDLASLLDTEKLKKRAERVYKNAHRSAQTQYNNFYDDEESASSKADASKWWKAYPLVIDPYIRDVLAAAADAIMKPEESERSAVRNMAARVQKLRQSTAGAWLKRDHENGRDIDLRKVADEGWVVVFSLDSSNYKATSQQVGGLIIQDLNTLSSELRSNPAPHPFHIYVDEFSAIGSDNIIDLLARARDARMPTMLSTQALADLKKADPSFLEQALGIVNCFIIHRANTEADAEIFAGLTGKKRTYKKRQNVEMTSGMPGGIGTGAATGQGMIEEVEEYVVLPSKFQALKLGECVYIAKSPQDRVVNPVSVIREDALLVSQLLATGKSGSGDWSAQTTASPFGLAEADLDEAFPSPWPIMAPASDMDRSHAEAEVAGVLPDARNALPQGLLSEDDYMSKAVEQFDTPAPDSAPPVVVAPRIPTRPNRAPIIDPAMYQGDAPKPVVPVPKSPPAAEVLLEAQQVPMMPQMPPLTVARPAQVVAPPVPVALPSLVFETAPSPEPEVSVFGGGDVEWEEDAPDWDAADLGVPVRAPIPLTELPAETSAGTPDTAKASGNPRKLPTTSEKPNHSLIREDEWNE